MMDESEFNQRVDDVLLQIEQALDACDSDIDYETSAGILTLEFPNRSKIILNRQTPLRQIWLAARSGGFHYVHDPAADRWRDQQHGEELFAALSRYCSEQAGAPIRLDSE